MGTGTNHIGITWKSLVLSIAFLFCIAAPAYALDVTLQWDANTETNLDGYKIYYKTGSSGGGVKGNYNGTGATEGNSPIDMPLNLDENSDPNVVEFTVHGLTDGQPYYFVTTAYNNNTPPLESSCSNEVNTGSPPSGDTIPPYVTNRDPASGATGVPVNTLITLEVRDAGVGVDQSTITMRVNGSQVTPSISGTTAAYTVSYNPPTDFAYDETVSVVVDASDLNGNAMNTESYSFTTITAPDTTPPVISNVQVTSTTHTTATIQWTTNEASDSQVQYGTTSGGYPSSKNSIGMVTSHIVTLTGLNADMTYYFRAVSTDASGNGPTISSEFTFTTDPAPDYTIQGLPLNLFDTLPPVSGDVVLTLNSIPIGTTAIELVITVYDPDFSDEGRLFINGHGPIALFGSQGDASKDAISVTLNPMATDASWYQLGDNTLTIWHDATQGFIIEDISVNFTSNPPPDTTPPVISNVQVTSITDITALVTWTTDEASDSEVQYGTASGSYPSNESSTSMVTSHSINLTGLLENTTYYYRVRSKDEANNTRTSSEMSFATNPGADTTPPSIVQYPTINYANDTIDVTYSEAVGSELIANGGMELDANWNNWSFEGSETNTRTSAQKHGGTYARRLTANSDDDGIISNTFATVTGNDYEVTFWVYPVDNSVVRFYVRAGDNQNHNGSAWINGTRVQGGLVLNQWNQVTTTYTEAGGGDSAYIILSSYAGGGTYYFDDVSIRDVSGSGGSGNATTEANYTFSPSMLFNTLGGSDDITHIGSNIYRLSMSSVPSNMIFTMTVVNITDETGNPLTPSFIRVNDNDNDGLADDWEATSGVSNPSADPDSDGLTNFEEFNNSTNPNNADTDGDTLPDGWEVTYGLDPTDSTGVNGGNGDFDNDGWTNSEEYANGYDPGSDTSPASTPPVIRKSIPRNNSGITNKKRVPTNSSFAVRLHDNEGIDITDTSSIEFTINDGVNPTYTRNLNNSSVFRVVKLTTDADTEVTKLWAVYDRSLDSYGNYQYDANVNIKVDAKDTRDNSMARASYDFNIESSSEQVTAQNNEPYTSTLANTPSTGLTTESIDAGDMAGAKVIYDNNEPVKPEFGPEDEIPDVDVQGVTPASYPLNLEPPTVFNTPVRIFIPVPNTDDVSNLAVCLYEGESWVVACDANGNVMPTGDGWMVPGSRVNHNNGNPSSIELQVYHFSAVQAAAATGPIAGVDADAEGGGGCFIGTVGKRMNAQKIVMVLLTFALAIVCITMVQRSKVRKS